MRNRSKAEEDRGARKALFAELKRKAGGRHTGAGAHRGVLDVEEGFGVAGHGCRGLMEGAQRQEGGIERG